MRGALVIFLAMVVIGIVLYLVDLLYYRRKKGYPPLSQKRDTRISSATTDSSAGSETSVLTDSSDASGVAETAGSSDDGACCGMHMVCEKTNLSPLTGEVVYYDDEELDRFRGREPESYTEEETEEFRDVLMTLLPQDVAGWSRSIQVRGISLPTDVRDELLMIVSELRQS